MDPNDESENHYISSVNELETNCFYCDSQSVFDSIDPANLNVPIKLIPHCLSLRLLHLFGPINNTNLQCRTLVLVANCVHNSKQNVLIAVKIDDDFFEDISLNHINRTFTLKNFKTVHSPDISFASSSVDCHILKTALYNLTIFASSEFKSILRFYNENFDGTNENSLVPQENDIPNAIEDQVMDDEESISDISIADLQQDILIERGNLMSEDDANSIGLVDSELVAQSRTDFRTINLTERQKTSTPNAKLFNSQIDNKIPASNVDQNLIVDSENQDPNNRDEQQISQNRSLNNSNIATRIEEILLELSDNIKQNYNIESFINSNIAVIGEENIELTKLSRLVYPSNAVQNFSFSNVIGIIKTINVAKNRRVEVTICDEDVEDFVVQLGCREIELVKRDPKQSDIPLFFPAIRLDDYPSLMSGTFICIRDLCLATKSTNICAHPNQIRLIESHKRHDKIHIFENKKLSQEEFNRLIELVCLSAKQLAINPTPRTTFTYKILNFAGQVLAKRVTPKRAQVFLLLPFKNSLSTFLSESDAVYIADQIENMSFSETRSVYKRETIEKLISDRCVITISFYENHINSLNTIIPLELLAFFNVHIKEDKYYAGFSQYILHGGNDFGRRCLQIDNNSILGCTVLKSIKELLKEAASDPALASLLDNYEANIDDNIISRLGGTSINQLAGKHNSNDNSYYPRTASTSKNVLRNNNNGELILLNPSVNLDAAKTIESFGDLTDCENAIFRISARMIDYVLEDKYGSQISNMAAFRRNFIKLLCSLPKCDFISSFDLMIPKITKIIASGDNQQQLTCPKCSSLLSPYLSIQIFLQDESEVSLAVQIASPEIDELIGCTSKQLLFVEPLSFDIVNALNYSFNSFCPIRRSADSNSRPNRRKKQNPMNKFESNPQLEWIIQSVKINQLDISQHPQMFNSHLFNDISSRIFYVRGILQSS